jgi:hypothetical protein
LIACFFLHCEDLLFSGFCLFGWFWSHMQGVGQVGITNRSGGSQWQLDPFVQVEATKRLRRSGS